MTYEAAETKEFLWQQLFADSPVVEDTDGDGYPDRIRLRVVVNPKLDDARVWAEILNLCAELAFEVTALDLPLVTGRCPSATDPILLVLPPGAGQGPEGHLLPAWGEILRRSPTTLCVRGQNGAGMAAILRGLTRCTAIPGKSPASRWNRIVLNEADPRAMRFFDSTGSLLATLEEVPPQQRWAVAAVPERPRGKNRAVDFFNLMGPEGLYASSSLDPRGRRLAVQIKLPAEKLSHRLGVALAECVARLALEATELPLPMVTTEQPAGEGPVLEIKPTQAAACRIQLTRSGSRKVPVILAQGSSEALARQLPNWIYWGLLEGGRDWCTAQRLRRQVEDLKAIVEGRGTRGRWAHALVRQARPATRQPAGLPAICAAQHPAISRACAALSLDPPAVAPSLPTLRRRSRWSGEANRLEAVIADLAPGTGLLHGEIFASKPLPERRRLAERLQAQLAAKGYQPQLRVFNAYKPGLSWLLEKILPRLKQLPERPRSLELRFRPAARGKGALEMKSRWLQEIYPGPDLLARTLQLPTGALSLHAAARQRSVYRLLAWDGQKRLLLDEEFSPRCTRIPCCDGERGSRWAHPTTAGIRLWQGRKELLNRDVATDREMFWKTFWESWMPEVFSHMRQRLDDPALASRTAFWESFRIDVAIAETECRLPLGEEGISPMEALHEDLYFGLLEAFKSFASQHRLPGRLQLGQIIPRVKSQTTLSGPSARLTAKPAAWPQVPPRGGTLPPAKYGGVDIDSGHAPFTLQREISRGSALPEPSALRGRAEVTGLALDTGSWQVELGGTLGRWDPGDRNRLRQILQAWGFAIQASPHSKKLVVSFKAPRKTLPTQSFEDTPHVPPPPVDRMLSAREVHRYLRRIGQLPQLQAWQAGESLQGRPVYAVEAYLQGGGALRSVTKARLFRPTLFFNARHHANEISSTGTALHLLWELAATERGRKLLQQVNVVCIPLENVDGVATLEKLLPEARHHKLHAARYNALGAEYYGDYFNPAPPAPEAQVKPRLWQRWLPEIMVDGHGVPSHEWEQPFSGYAPGRFREFWIPRTFLYAYIPYVDQPDHQRHRLALELKDRLSTAVSRDAALVALNREIQDRYQRYALQWEPQTFPPVGGEPLVVLPPSKRVAKTNFGYRRPQVTTAEIITEVVDEVVSGSMLELCVRSHRIVLEALTDFLQAQSKRAIKKIHLFGNQLHLVWQRQH